MKKSWLEIYALAICFFTVACFAVALGAALWDVVQITAPDFTMRDDYWTKHRSDEAFRQALIEEHRFREVVSTYVPPAGAELTLAREEGHAQAVSKERRAASQGLAQRLIILLVDLLVFLIHWKIAARARQNTG